MHVRTRPLRDGFDAVLIVRRLDYDTKLILVIITEVDTKSLETRAHKTWAQL